MRWSALGGRDRHPEIVWKPTLAYNVGVKGQRGRRFKLADTSTGQRATKHDDDTQG